MNRLAWLGALWPLAFVPFLHDPTPVRDSGTSVREVRTDTTYGDGRYVAIVPVVQDTNIVGTDTFVRVRPDPDSIGTGKRFRAVRKPSGDSFLVISYDTLVKAALDSAAVDSIWSDWGLGTPLAYAVEVPGELGVDTSGSFLYVNFDEYASTLDMKTAAGDFIADTGVWLGSSSIFLDTTEAYTAGGFEKSARHDWAYDGACGDEATSFTGCESASRNIEVDFDSSLTRVWGEMSFKLDSTAATLFSGCPYNENWFKYYPDTAYVYQDTEGVCAWKWWQYTTNGYYRWLFIVWSAGGSGPDAGWTTEGPYRNTGANPFIANVSGAQSNWLADGEWHLMRWHLANSTDSLTYNGEFMVWVDDSLVADMRAEGDSFATHNNARMISFSTGRNKDHGGNYIHTESYWIGHLTMWADTPSWYTDPSP